jgi:SAM-dependent methyltransferase
MTMKEHWDSIYREKSAGEMSWTQLEPLVSLRLIREVCPSGRVIDVGGGTSVLAERLLDLGYEVAVLDISDQAIERCRKRLGAKANRIQWISADVAADPELGTFDVWHDRAVFHFLTSSGDRLAYKELLLKTIPVGGHAVIGSFALDGPEKCSGLDVQRYDAASLSTELGKNLALLKSEFEMHITPWGKPQSFQFSLFKRLGSPCQESALR